MHTLMIEIPWDTSRLSTCDILRRKCNKSCNSYAFWYEFNYVISNAWTQQNLQLPVNLWKIMPTCYHRNKGEVAYTHIDWNIVQTFLTLVLVTHLYFMQPQQDPHRFCQVTKVQSRPYCNSKNWATNNSCCIFGWEKCTSVVNSKKHSNNCTVCDWLEKGGW